MLGSLNPFDAAHTTATRPPHILNGLNQRRWFSDPLTTELTGQDLNAILAMLRYAIDFYSIADIEGDDTLLQKAIQAGAGALTGNTAALQVLVGAPDKVPFFASNTVMSTFTATSYSRGLLAKTSLVQWQDALGISAFSSPNVVAFSALAGGVDQLGYFTGIGTMAQTPITAFARTLLDDTSNTAARATLGIAIGSNVQAYDPTLDALALLDVNTGLMEQTGPDAFTKRAIGVATAASIPTRADADARYSLVTATIAAQRMLGNVSGVAAVPAQLTNVQVKTFLSIQSGDVGGLGALATKSTILDADVAPGAAIALSKLASITDQRLLGNVSGTSAAASALTQAQVKTFLNIQSGDVSGLGALATKSTIADIDVAAGADIALTKLRAVSDQRLLGNVSGVSAPATGLTVFQVKTFLALVVGDVTGALAKTGDTMTGELIFASANVPIAAGTTDFGAVAGNWHSTTGGGGVTVTSFGVGTQNQLKFIRHAGTAYTISVVGNAANISAPVAEDIVVQPNDSMAIRRSSTSGLWQIIFFQRADGGVLNKALTSLQNNVHSAPMQMGTQSGQGNVVAQAPGTGGLSNLGFVGYDLAQIRVHSPTTTGALVFTAPAALANVMYELEVVGHVHGASPNNSKFLVRGYRNTVASGWLNTGIAHLTGLRPMVRWATDPAGNACLILGDVGTVWSWPHFHLSVGRMSHVGATVALVSNWSAALLNDLTGYTNISADLTTTAYTPLAISEGGTGGTDAATARTNLSAARSDAAQTLIGNQTITGGFLIVDRTGQNANAFIRSMADVSQLSGYQWYKTGLRWAALTTSAAESGGNAGSDWNLNRYTDGGVLIDTPISINRATSLISMSGTLVVDASNNDLFVDDANARVYMGASAGKLVAAVNGGTIQARLQVQGATGPAGAALLYAESTLTALRPVLYIARAGVGGGVIANGNDIGSVEFEGHDGTQLLSMGRINVVSNGAVATNSLPADMAFHVNQGAAASIEVMRLRTSGDLAMGSAGGTTVIDSNRIFRLRPYTIATLPSASPAGQEVYCSDLGGGGGLLVSDGTNWRRTSDGYAIKAQNAANITWLVDANNLETSATLTANRSMALQVTNAYAGAIVNFRRSGLGAFTLTLTNAGPGGGTLITFASATPGVARLYFNGTDWVLWA